MSKVSAGRAIYRHAVALDGFPQGLDPGDVSGHVANLPAAPLSALKIFSAENAWPMAPSVCPGGNFPLRVSNSIETCDHTSVAHEASSEHLSTIA